jgi:hypothetical protein
VPYAGSLALSDILEKTDTLVTACSRCNRAGRYPMTILIKQHGATYTVPLLLCSNPLRLDRPPRSR